MKTIIAALTALLILTACSKDAGPKFGEGQIWSFNAAEDEPDAKLTIVKIEPPTGRNRIIYVSLSEIQLGGLPAYQFMPFSEEAVKRSVKSMVSEDGQLSGADAGEFKLFYESWQTGVASGAYNACFKDTVGKVWAQKRADSQKK